MPQQLLASPSGADVKRVRGRVLVVDDDPVLLRLHQQVLAKVGFDVEISPNALEAIDLVSRERFDVVLSDIAMPDLDGLGLIRAVREHDSDLPVVLITGRPSVGTAVGAVDLGALKYLTKPVHPKDLRDAMAYAVGVRRLASTRREAMTYLAERSAEANDLATLEAQFHKASDRLWMAYQPIVSWSERRIVGYEALVRSDEPALRNPDSLLGAAERLGRLQDLGRSIRNHAAKMAHALADDVDLLVNLHPEDLLDDSLYSMSEPMTSVSSKVVLELTERASIDQIPDLPHRLNGLRDLGFRLAVDDLGAGYAGLATFSRIQPDVVKIDMSLTRDVDREPTKRRIVQAMIRACSELNIAIITEGIETTEERDALFEDGCDLFQGYLFARPGRVLPCVRF